MRTDAGGRNRRRLSSAVSGVLVASLAAPAWAQTFVPELPPDEPSPLSKVVKVHTHLGGLGDQAFADTVGSLLSEGTAAGIDAVVLFAGTRVPPGLTAARTERRQSMRNQALSRMRADLAPDATADAKWPARLEELLSDPDAGEDRLVAALSTTAELGLYRLAPGIAANLEHGSARVAAAAREALYRLHGRWFADDAQFVAFRQEFGEGAPSGPYLDDLFVANARADDLLLRLFREAPVAVADDVFAAPDPALRARAARSLGSGVADQRVSAEFAIERLMQRVSVEVDMHAFHAAVGALLELLQGQPPESQRVAGLREALEGVAARRLPHLEASVVDALARLSWNPDGDGPASYASGVRRVAEILGGRSTDDRPFDVDLVVKELDSLGDISASSGLRGAELRAVTGPAHDAVASLVTRRDVSPEVRLAAARALPHVLTPADFDDVVRVLRDADSQIELRFALIGALGPAVRELDPAGQEARLVLEALVDLLDQDVDLRTRALRTLASDDLAPLVAVANDPSENLIIEPLVERLEKERNQELQAELLALVGRFRRPDLVLRVTTSANFVELTKGGTRRVNDAATALGAMAGGEHGPTLEIAQRLVLEAGVPDDERLTSRSARLEAALRLVFSLEVEEAVALTADEDGDVVRWALELSEARGAPAGAPETLKPELDRLVDVHLAGWVGTDEPDSHPYERARLVGDRLVASGLTGDAGAVLSAYRVALEEARAASDAELESRILRDRARFRLAIGRRGAALVDYRELFTTPVEGEETPVVVEALPPGLGLQDARATGQLLADPDLFGERTRREAAVESFDVTLLLVTDDRWKREPEKTRLEDLSRLTRQSVATADPERYATTTGILAGIPPLAEDGGVVDVNGNGAAQPELWYGLLRQRPWHEALIELRKQLPAADGEGDGEVPAVEPGGGARPDGPRDGGTAPVGRAGRRRTR